MVAPHLTSASTRINFPLRSKLPGVAGVGTKKEFGLKKVFGVIAFILFFLINESTMSWLLAVVVGQYSWLAAWFALTMVVTFHAYGYWEVQHSLYTSEHTSSTASIAFIFIPFHAMFYGVIAGAAGYLLGLFAKVVATRT